MASIELLPAVRLRHAWFSNCCSRERLTREVAAIRNFSVSFWNFSEMLWRWGKIELQNWWHISRFTSWLLAPSHLFLQMVRENYIMVLGRLSTVCSNEYYAITVRFVASGPSKEPLPFFRGSFFYPFLWQVREGLGWKHIHVLSRPAYRAKSLITITVGDFKETKCASRKCVRIIWHDWPWLPAVFNCVVSLGDVVDLLEHATLEIIKQ